MDFCILLLFLFLVGIFLYSILNVSSGLLLNIIKVPIATFFLNMKIVLKVLLKKWKSISAFPRLYSIYNRREISCFNCRHRKWQSSYFIGKLYLYSGIYFSELCKPYRNLFGWKSNFKQQILKYIHKHFL